MEFHRLNLGFLLPKGLRETNRKMAKRGEVRLTQRLAERGQGRGIQSGRREGADQRGTGEKR